MTRRGKANTTIELSHPDDRLSKGNRVNMDDALAGTDGVPALSIIVVELSLTPGVIRGGVGAS